MSRPLLKLGLSTAWRQWTALGVAGTQAHADTAVDLEALLLFTGCVVEDDPRLADEVADWMLQHASRFSSGTRLRNLRRGFDAASVGMFDRLVRGASTHGRLPWPSSGEALRVKPSGKSRLERLDNVPCSLLRLRCVFGITARAEVLLSLLVGRRSDDWVRASELAELGYVKRNIVSILDDLVIAGLVEHRRPGNAFIYRVRDRAVLRAVLSPLPSRPGEWHQRLPLLARFIQLEKRIDGKSAIIQSVEARKLVEEQREGVASAEFDTKDVSEPADYWMQLQGAIADRAARW